MNRVLFHDNFLPDAMAQDFRTAGVNAHYPPEGVRHEGTTYPGMSLTLDSDFERDMAPYIAAAAGAEEVAFAASFFRCMLAGQDTGNGHDFRAHYDSDFGTHAFVLYLSEPGTEVGGTAFWKHKALGDIAINESNQEQLSEDLTRREAWRAESFVGMRYNRAALFPANRIHSAYPQEGWGDKPAQARLIWATFVSFR